MPSDRPSRASRCPSGATGLRWAGKLNMPLYRASRRANRRQGRQGAGAAADHYRPQDRVSHGPRRSFTSPTRAAGRDQHQRRQRPVPAWSLNSRRTPMPRSRSAAAAPAMRARVAEGEERADLWRKHNEQYAGFDDYESRSSAARSAVFVLEPRRRRRQPASRSICASGRRFSFFSVLFSIWRIRSRVTPKVRPTSSRVSGSSPERP